MEQLKIGVVGGRRGMTFMETLRSMGEWACLYAVCENDPLVVEARRENGYLDGVKLFDDYYPVFRNNYAFINNYSKYCWANNENDIKRKSITIIKDYFITRPRISQEEYLELLSLSVTNQTILAINEKDELKELREWESISDSEYKEKSKVIKDTFKAIFNNSGRKLYDACIDIDLMALSPSCRPSCLQPS